MTKCSLSSAGDFLNRFYSAAVRPISTQSVSAYPVSLFIRLPATQRTGQAIHSPLHCLPGAGWVFESRKYTSIDDIKGKQYNVGEYIINNGESRQFVIYWYQAHGRSIANEYKAKAYMLADAIRYNRTDGALVRVDHSLISRRLRTGRRCAGARGQLHRAHDSLFAAVHSQLRPLLTRRG